MKRSWILTLFVPIAIQCSVVSSANQDGTLIEKAVKAWGRGYANIRSAQVEVVTEAGTFGRFSRHHNEWAPMNSGTGEAPPTRLSIDGIKVRCDSTAWSGDEHNAKIEPFDFDDVDPS